MLRQYHAPRFRYTRIGGHSLPIGTLPIGTILDPQDNYSALRSAECRNPWIIEAWLPREIGAGRRDFDGKWAESYNARPMSVAIIRDLRSGRIQRITDHHLLAASDHGLERFGQAPRGSFAALAAVEEQISLKVAA